MKKELCQNCGLNEATKSAYDLPVCDDCFADMCEAQNNQDTEYAEELDFDPEIEELE